LYSGFYLFLQVQYPLSLVSVKYKHFLIFGLGGPILNTLIWFATRIADHGDHGDHGDHRDQTGTEEDWQVEQQWEGLVPGEVGCPFAKRKMVDRWVMELPILIILFFNTFFLVWIIFVSCRARGLH
jgi:hypothetical protein